MFRADLTSYQLLLHIRLYRLLPLEARRTTACFKILTNVKWRSSKAVLSVFLLSRRFFARS